MNTQKSKRQAPGSCSGLGVQLLSGKALNAVCYSGFTGVLVLFFLFVPAHTVSASPPGARSAANSQTPLTPLAPMPAQAMPAAAPATATSPAQENTPYQAIVDRNLFGLKPPAAEAGAEGNKPPPPAITLNGITTILGNKRALMKVAVPAGKPGQAAKEESFMLAEGQSSDGVEVIEIDEKLGTVRVNDYGTITNLTFKENGPKVAAAPAGPLPGGFLSAPLNPAPGSGPGSPPLRTIPTRSLRVPSAGAAPVPGAAANNPAGSTYGGFTPQSSTMPGGLGAYQASGAAPGLTVTPGTTTPGKTTFQSWPPEAPMGSDEQAAMHVLQSQANPDTPPFPGLESPQNPLGQSGTAQGNTGTRTSGQQHWTIPGQPTSPPLPQ